MTIQGIVGMWVVFCWPVLTAGAAQPVADFDWVMLDQFDPASPGLPAGVLLDVGWKVTLNGCLSTSPGADPIVQYDWEINLPDGPRFVSRNLRDGMIFCSTILSFPKQGVYRVKLTVTAQSGVTNSVTKYIKVRGLLIVSLGDSIASGEGNPDSLQIFPSLCDLGGTCDGSEKVTSPGPQWADEPCHRSNWSGHALAAYQVGRHVSDLFVSPAMHHGVGFLSVACSGAGIFDGLLAPQVGHNSESQIAQVANLLCAKPDKSCTRDELRNIDALLIQIGANDAHFSDLVTQCGIDDTEFDASFRLVGSSCVDDQQLWSTVEQSIAQLPEKYRDLNDVIQSRLKFTRVYVAQYPDPTHDQNGLYCKEIVFPDAKFGFIDGIIDERSAEMAYRSLIMPLNATLHAAAVTLNWTFVDLSVIPLTFDAYGLPAALFGTHGYCVATLPVLSSPLTSQYPSPAQLFSLDPSGGRWIRTYSESQKYQGDINGTLHPNIWGHYVYGESIALALTDIVRKADLPPADLNEDGSVDCQDLAIVLGNFGKSPGQMGFDPLGDFNHGTVDITDVAFIARNLPEGTICNISKRN